MKKFYYTALGAAVIVAGCSNTSEVVENITSDYVTYADDDFYTPWQNKNFTKIEMVGDSVSIDGTGGAVFDKGTLEIHTSGTYVLSGTLEGQIIVNTEDKGTVRLILNGVDITSSTSAAIYVKQADKTVLSLEEGTKNTVTDAQEYVYAEGEDEPKAAIFSKDDLTINGTGSLTVNAQFADGITGRDDVLITGGDINITSADDGLVGRDLLAVRDANIVITSVGDGVKSTNDETEGKGNIVLESGTLTIHSEADGIQAIKELIVVDGEYNITTGGGSPETIATEMMGGGMGMPGGQMPNDFDPDNLPEDFDPSQMPENGGEGRGEKPTGNFDPSQMPQQNGQTDNTMQQGQGDPSDMSPPQQPQGSQAGETTQQLNNQSNDTQQQQPNNQTDNAAQQQQPNNQIDNTAQQQQLNDQTDGTQQQQMQMPGQGRDDQATEEVDDESVSTKALKAGTAIRIIGGNFTIDSLDDAVHSNGTVTIDGGEFSIATGDDGVHADTDLIINDGNINITKSYEGLEGINVTINDGYIHLTAADDGINVNGGSSDMMGGPMMNPGQGQATETAEATEATEKTETTDEEESLLLINGGYVYVNADGDGLDSNSDIKMTGGTVVVYGPTNNGNGALDYDGEFAIEGGTLIAAGSSGMAMGVSDTSTQATIMMTFTNTQEAGTTVYVENSNGEQVVAVAPEKAFQTIVVSSPQLQASETYSLAFGGTTTGEPVDGVFENVTIENSTGTVEFTLPDTVMTYVNESGITENGGMMHGGFGGGGGMMPGGRGGREQQGQSEQPEQQQNSDSQ